MMKKICLIVLVMVLCFDVACSNEEEINMQYQTGIFYDKNWDDPVGTYNGDVIPNENTAISIATQIFDSMEKSNAYDHFKPQAVFYDEQDAVWIVSLYNSEEMHTGGDCNIAMQKRDGKILRIWFGE